MRPPCQLVNPLCPDDLCQLSDRHRGPHHLSTMGRPGPVGPLLRRHGGAPVETDRLIEMGWERQRRLGIE